MFGIDVHDEHDGTVRATIRATLRSRLRVLTRTVPGYLKVFEFIEIFFRQVVFVLRRKMP